MKARAEIRFFQFDFISSAITLQINFLGEFNLKILFC